MSPLEPVAPGAAPMPPARTAESLAMRFPHPAADRGSIDKYGLTLRKAAKESAARVPPPACADVTPRRFAPLGRCGARPCWYCWYCWYGPRQQGGSDGPCGS